MLSRRIAMVVLAAAAMTLTAGAGTALAGVVTKVGDTITFTATAGEVNDLTVSDPAGSVVFDEPGRAVTPGPGCSPSGDMATCDATGVTRVVMELGDGDDAMDASSVDIAMTVNGGEGNDGRGPGVVEAGNAVDTVNGGPGDDFLAGGTGNDTLNGEAGNDELFGFTGDDEHNGGDGFDTFRGGSGADGFTGGTGFDVVAYDGAAPGETIDASLDGRANDGLPGEGDNIGPEVEDIRGGPSNDRLTGDVFFNLLTGDSGTDTLDPGNGEDVVDAGADDDTIFVRDGFADRVLCGGGIDTVTADTLDRIEADCENVSVANVAFGRDDRPPTVSFAGPSENAFLPTTSASTITALASDDRGVAEVQLIDDGRVVRTDTTSPYTFSYRPRGEDVGRNTLVLLAVDTAQQTASAVRPLRVARFAPRALIGKVTPTRRRFAPFRYRTTGRIRLPRGVTRAQGCRGRVSIQVKRGTKTISSRRVALGKKCGFSSRVVFHNRRRVGFGSLRFVVRFLGNSVLIPRSGLTLKARTS